MYFSDGRKQGALRNEDTKRRWQRWRMKKKEFAFTSKGKHNSSACMHAHASNYVCRSDLLWVLTTAALRRRTVSIFGDVWKPVSLWIGPDQEKSELSRFESLYQPFFGFWLFAWSRCGQIVKKSSRKYSWTQNYSVLLMSASPSCHRYLSPARFESKLFLFWLKEALTKFLKSFLFDNLHWSLDHFW